MNSVVASRDNFSIQRADACIWLNDLRVPKGHPCEIHLTPDQAKRLGEALVRASEHGPGYDEMTQ